MKEKTTRSSEQDLAEIPSLAICDQGFKRLVNVDLGTIESDLNILKVLAVVLFAASFAVTVTVVVPIGKFAPLAWE